MERQREKIWATLLKIQTNRDPISNRPTRANNNNNNNNNNRPSYASVVRQKSDRPTSRPTPNPIAGRFIDEAKQSLKEAIEAIKVLGRELQEIKNEMTKMDDRIGHLEDDSYFVHCEQGDIRKILNMETPIRETSKSEDDHQTMTSGRQTPTEQFENITESAFNYQRKRPALSPANDLRNEQQEIYGRINRMGDTLEQLTSSLSEFQRLTTDNTPPPPEEQ